MVGSFLFSALIGLSFLLFSSVPVIFLTTICMRGVYCSGGLLGEKLYRAIFQAPSPSLLKTNSSWLPS